MVEYYQPQSPGHIDQLHDDVEALVNTVHLDSNGILRCAITVGHQANRVHLFVFEQYEGDRLYMIMKFKEGLQEMLNI